MIVSSSSMLSLQIGLICLNVHASSTWNIDSCIRQLRILHHNNLMINDRIIMRCIPNIHTTCCERLQSCPTFPIQISSWEFHVAFPMLQQSPWVSITVELVMSSSTLWVSSRLFSCFMGCRCLPMFPLLRGISFHVSNSVLEVLFTFPTFPTLLVPCHVSNTMEC